MAKPIPAETLLLFIADRQAGLTVREIAARYGYSVGGTERAIKRLPAARIRLRCLGCERPMVARYAGHRYCSARCYEVARPREGWSGPTRSVCSDEEIAQIRAEREEEGLPYTVIGPRHYLAPSTVETLLYGKKSQGGGGQLPPGKRRRVVPRVCVQCGKSFVGVPWRHYCTARCAQRARTDRRPWPSTVPHPCRGCGQPFKRRKKEFRYCSPDCKRSSANARAREARRAGRWRA